MSYIGAEPTTAAFPFDQFSGDGTTTAFTLTYAPASTTSIIVAISGVMQNPNLYSVVGTTLTFSPAPPTGTNNISVLYLGLPVIGSSSPGNTAFLSSTDLTATAGQTVFASAGSYTPGFVQVYRNGARLGNADFTATNGTTITLANAATSGDLVTIEYYTLTSLTNALPLTGGTVTGSTTFNSTVTVNGAAVSGFTGMKNRIINGNMVIDQRNAGAAVTGDGAYPVDRFQLRNSSDGTVSGQQVSDAPSGFINSFKWTTTAADASLSAAQYTAVYTNIEGLNITDFAWGTASAATITLSFWVKSSITGTFSGALANSAYDRSYPFNYTISVASTWEYKTITIAGDTSGTWLTTNGLGIRLYMSLGAGSNFTGTASSWNATGRTASTTGTASVIGTLNATWQFTGVQLERGSNATSFEFIDYGRQLAQCQRYYVRVKPSGAGYPFQGAGIAFSTSNARLNIPFPVQMRAIPSALEQSGTAGDYSVLQAAWVVSTSVPIMAVASYTAITVTFISTSGYTQYAGAVARDETGNAYLGWSAEL